MIPYRIDFAQSWRPAPNVLIHAGIYRVPIDLSEDLAGRALAKGAAMKLPDAPASKQQRKRPAPENKLLGSAPENKADDLTTAGGRWTECIVAASGPSLTEEVAQACRGRQVIAVNDAYRLLPFADALYACDAAWWDVHKGCQDFAGEKWSSHGNGFQTGMLPNNDKAASAERYHLKLIRGRHGEGFSFQPGLIHYGSNSGFQAVNLAILLGAKRILLVGFDMRSIAGRRHFFGNHPRPLNRNTDYARFIPEFERAAALLPPDIEIINCTPGSALRCFKMMDLCDALSAAP